MGLFGSGPAPGDNGHHHDDDDDGHHHDDDDGHKKFKLPKPGNRFRKPPGTGEGKFKIPPPGDRGHKPHEPDPDKKPGDDDDKGDNDGGTTSRVSQGRWRTVVTEKVPREDLTAPEENRAEHRPLGF